MCIKIALIIFVFQQADTLMALPSAVVEEGVNKVFSYISTKFDDKALTADTIARIEIALSQLDFVLEKTGKIAITYVSLLRRWKIFKRVHMEGMDLLNKYKLQEAEVTGQAVVRSSSYLQRIANRAANLSISSLVGLSKEPLSSSVATTFERYADWAEKFVAEVESSCPLRHVTFRYPFLRHLFEGKTLVCKMVKNPSQSLRFYLHPEIVEGRGVEVKLVYVYEDCRTLEKCFYIFMNLRISEDTDIIGIIIKCMQWLTAQFKLAVESAIGELTLLPSLQDIFHSSVHPPSFMIEDQHDSSSKFFRPDPICCKGNSHGTLASKSSIQIPEPVIEIYFSCYMSAPEKSLRNAPLSLTGLFAPHFPRSNGDICIQYAGKEETRNGGSVQQLEQIARSDALDYLVHEPEPTDYALFWFSPHGVASVILRSEAMPRPGRRVSKRKR